MSYCSNCGVKVAEGVSFCPSCGTRVGTGPIKCSNCGAIIAEGTAFCSGCGAKAVSPREVALEKNNIGSKDKRELDMVKGEIKEMTRNQLGAVGGAVIGLICMLIGAGLGVQTAQRTESAGLFSTRVIAYHPHADAAVAFLVGGGVTLILALILWMYFNLKKGELIRKKRYLEK
jgi:RNA polymerase subunit RPABC4/transcription elongation factor Spt4